MSESSEKEALKEISESITKTVSQNPDLFQKMDDNLFKPSNPKDNAATSRLALSLFPQTAIAYGALAMTEGDCKYGGYNYRVAGVNASIYVDALFRHVFKWYNGEECDPITKVPHLGNAIACLAVMIDAIEKDKGRGIIFKDDRPPKSDVSDLIARFQDVVKHLQTIFNKPPGRYTELQHGEKREEITSSTGGSFTEKKV